MTPSQHGALRWLVNQGGYAMLDPYGHAVARGQKGQHAPATWLRLFISGHLTPATMAGYFTVTATGTESARKARP